MLFQSALIRRSWTVCRRGPVPVRFCRWTTAGSHDAAAAAAAWKEMNDKSRSLAELLVGEDDDGVVRDAEQREIHSFNRRRGLAQAVTLIESKQKSHQRQSCLLLTYLLNQDSNHRKKSTSFRLGIAGPPGAGKSTFIEAFGRFLLNSNNESINVKDQPHTKCQKMAVVCIDPSSSITGGSILGDKTRMAELSVHERAYVRPSPTRNVLGGLSAYTEDVVSFCQVAGYDFVIVETVGLGQSEIEVKESVDMLVLMVPPGGGDDLQGIKKGIVEVSDMIVVTKADGNFLPAAKTTAADYRGALRIMPGGGKARPGWELPPVLLVSSQTGTGMDEVWNQICRFRAIITESGELQSKRQAQQIYWLWKNVRGLILERASNDQGLTGKAKELQLALKDGKTTPRVAAYELLESITKI